MKGQAFLFLESTRSIYGRKIAAADNIAYGLFGFAATEKMHRALPKDWNALKCNVVAREDIAGAVLSGAPIAEAKAIP